MEAEAVHHFHSTITQNSGNIKHLHTYIKKVDGGWEGLHEKKQNNKKVPAELLGVFIDPSTPLSAFHYPGVDTQEP